MKKSTIFQIIRAGVSLSLILLLLYIMRGKYAQIIESITRANLPLLIASLTVFLAAITLASLRLMLIIAAQGTPVTFIDSISLTFIGYFFNNFLPTAIGGDFVKGYYLSKRTGDRTGSYTAIFVDRAIGLFTMIFMAFIALLFAESGVIDKPLRNLIYIITAISAAFIFFMAHRSFARRFSFLLFLVRPIEEKLRNIYTAVNKYRHHKILMIQSLFISIISQLLYFVSLGIVAMSIGSFISISDVLLRMPIVSAISLLPSINGLGVREGSMVLLFGPIIGKTSAFAVSIVMLALLFAVSIIGGIIYMVSPQFKIKIKEAMQESKEAA